MKDENKNVKSLLGQVIQHKLMQEGKTRIEKLFEVYFSTNSTHQIISMTMHSLRQGFSRIA